MLPKQVKSDFSEMPVSLLLKKLYNVCAPPAESELGRQTSGADRCQKGSLIAMPLTAKNIIKVVFNSSRSAIQAEEAFSGGAGGLEGEG